MGPLYGTPEGDHPALISLTDGLLTNIEGSKLAGFLAKCPFEAYQRIFRASPCMSGS